MTKGVVRRDCVWTTERAGHGYAKEQLHPVGVDAERLTGLEVDVFKCNLLIIRSGYVGLASSPRFKTSKAHRLRFPKILEGRLRRGTWYHIFVEWNDYGDYRFVARDSIEPSKLKYPYWRRLGAVLTRRGRRVLRECRTFKAG